MTTNKTRNKPYQRVPALCCDLCGEQYSPRRRSSTGRNFCGKQACQAKRRRVFRTDQLESARNQGRLEGQPSAKTEAMMAQMNKYIDQVEWVLGIYRLEAMADCDTCGAQTVPPKKFVHPGPRGFCEALGDEPMSPRLMANLWRGKYVDSSGDLLVES